VAAVDAYHVFGGLFAVWAVIVSFLGVTREDFPATTGTQRLVALVSVLLAVATIGSAIYTGATEDEEEGGEQEQALVLGI
jgi:formate-dependent nitrite reductase membrane component NrfD